MKPSLMYGVAVGTVAVALDATDGVAYYWLTEHLNPFFCRPRTGKPLH